MTWKADKRAFLNAMRAMRTPRITDYIERMEGSGLPVVPAVASDMFADLSQRFADGRGVVIFTRSDDVVDVFVFRRIGAPSHDHRLPDHTMGALVEASDRVSTNAFEADPQMYHRQFTLAA